jgi:hypothetical protein
MSRRSKVERREFFSSFEEGGVEKGSFSRIGRFIPQYTYGCFPWFSWNRKTSSAAMPHFLEGNAVFLGEFLPMGFSIMIISSQGI